MRQDPFARVTTRIPSAVLLNADELSRAVAERYSQIARMLGEMHKEYLRVWNYVPGIVEQMASGMDRYMAFNRGRHAAYAEWYGREERFEQLVPAASAVGIGGQDLVIDCLASSAGRTHVDNPRQIASCRYSLRYGPKPPCFARGTITSLRGERVLLLAGTASIVGEESQHPGNIKGQVLETLRNIEAVIVNAGGADSDPLRQLTDARIYVAHAEDAETAEIELRSRTAATIRIETALAALCRPELLVEIEGLAVLSSV